MATPGQVPAQFVPWGLHPMPKWIITELKNRGKEYDINMSPTDSKPYSGPRTAWVRVFSNGISSLAPDKEGFVLGGSEGFNESYGFDGDNKITVGVDASGKPHQIDSGFFYTKDRNEHADIPHRPPPSVESLDCEFMGGQNASFPSLCRKIKINWKCNSLGQLNYLEPYLLTPRISVLAEWGWNNYDATSLVDLTDKEWLYGIFKDPWYTRTWIEKSNGNYDLGMGYITNYGYNLNDAGGYDCFTEITNANFLIEGQSYQNTSITKKDPSNPSGSIKLKDFTEFMINDSGNIELNRIDTRHNARVSTIIPINDARRVFRPGKNAESKGVLVGKANTDNKEWLRMDVIEEIINRFFSLKMLDKDGSPTSVKIAQFKIDNVVINAHPALKSVTPNILFPNKIAPRFVSKASGSLGVTGERKTFFGQSGGTPDDARYLSLFPNVKNFIVENEFTYEYDDLKQAINPGGNSFPMYTDLIPQNVEGGSSVGGVASGYWGYLRDVFIELGFFKRLASENDTVLKLLESLLQHISEAMCNISQLKIIPAPTNDYYTVIDTSFTAIKTSADASALPNITIGSLDSAFIKSAELDVKLSVEMSNQMIMQSATGKDIPEGYGRGNVDPKTAKVSRFAMGDRLFDVGVYDELPPSNVDKKSGSKFRLTRMYTREGSFFDYITREDYSYILCENDSLFMRNILNDPKDKNATHIHNPIMPGTTFRFETLGMGGFMYLSQFTLANVPNTYSSEYSVWQISDVKHRVENKVWTTNVVAQVRPLSVL